MPIYRITTRVYIGKKLRSRTDDIIEAISPAQALRKFPLIKKLPPNYSLEIFFQNADLPDLNDIDQYEAYKENEKDES